MTAVLQIASVLSSHRSTVDQIFYSPFCFSLVSSDSGSRNLLNQLEKYTRFPFFEFDIRSKSITRILDKIWYFIVSKCNHICYYTDSRVLKYCLFLIKIQHIISIYFYKINGIRFNVFYLYIDMVSIDTYRYF